MERGDVNTAGSRSGLLKEREVMIINPPGHPEITYLRAFAGTRIARLSDARKRHDMGASAIELAIITAILVGLAVTVLVIIDNVVTSRAGQINSNNGRIP
jgi:hypothetical protein